MGPLLAAALRWLTVLLFAPRARWTGVAPSERQRIYFANHTSNADFTVIWASLPDAVRRRTRPVANIAYWNKAPGGLYLARNVFNALLVEHASARPGVTPEEVARAAAHTVAGIVAEMGEAWSLIIFPEGHRSRDGMMGPFKSGLFHLARARPDVELVPVYLENLDRVLPRGEVIPIPLMASVTFGPPLAPAAGETKEAFLARARAAVEALKGA